MAYGKSLDFLDLKFENKNAIQNKLKKIKKKQDKNIRYVEKYSSVIVFEKKRQLKSTLIDYTHLLSFFHLLFYCYDSSEYRLS